MKTILSILCILVASSAKAHNPIWANLDKHIIEDLVKIDKDSVHLIAKYFETPSSEKKIINLGFGWKIWSPAKSGGYISLSSNFFFLNDSLMSFEINAMIPEDRSLKEKYLKWYNDYFTVINNKLSPFCYNKSIMLSPLDSIDDNLRLNDLNEVFSQLMQPTSNTSYYWFEGYESRTLSSRKVFMESSNPWNYQKLMYLTYSKNPVTRFLAIEELIRRNYIETKCSNQDLGWIEKCFKEVPNVETFHGCIRTTESSKFLVHMFSQIK